MSIISRTCILIEALPEKLANRRGWLLAKLHDAPHKKGFKKLKN